MNEPVIFRGSAEAKSFSRIIPSEALGFKPKKKNELYKASLRFF